MLSVRRAGVSVALELLHQQGLISMARSNIVIVDRQGLKALANGLYGVPEAEYLQPGSLQGPLFAKRGYLRKQDSCPSERDFDHALQATGIISNLRFAGVTGQRLLDKTRSKSPALRLHNRGAATFLPL